MDANLNIQLNVNFNFQQLLDAIKKLSPKEKLQINEALWEADMDIPLVHQELVMRRVEKSRRDSSRLLNWEEVSKKW